MPEIRLRADTRQMERDLRRVSSTIVPRVQAQTLNRVNRGIVTVLVRELSRELNIKPQKRVRRRVRIPKGDRRFNAAPDRLSAGGLMLFNYVPEIYLHGRSTRSARGAQGPNKFLAEMPSGHVGLYRRQGPKRLPIRQSLVDVQIRVAGVADRIIEGEGGARWRREITRRLTAELRKRGRR